MKMNYVMPLTQEVTFNGQNVMKESLEILTVSTGAAIGDDDAD